MPATLTWPGVEIEWRTVGTGTEIAVVVGFTHDIAAAVERYVSDELTEVGQLAICRAAGGANPQFVRSGHHAAYLAIALVAALLDKQPIPRTHLFLAAPNALGFMLGQPEPDCAR